LTPSRLPAEAEEIGWAGWDHKDQAAVVVALVTDRATDAGWGADRP